VFTSNVDGQFQAAGFAAELLLECHGSIHHLQCLDACTRDVWPASELEPLVDADTCQLRSPLPRCPHCGGLARPNILMFGDAEWIGDRQRLQQRKLENWLGAVRHPVVIEIGAGTAIPSVRRFGEQLRCPLIRINPREPGPVPENGVSLPMGALAALQAIGSLLNG
jgi:NAD-dependent SIR2 family protein deacetylase